MFIRLFFYIESISILIKGIDGYVGTYADKYYGRIRGSNQATGVDPAVIFLMVFGCIVGGFFIVCIFGTIILGIFDNGFRCPYRSSSRKTIPPNESVNPFIPSTNSRL